MAAGYSGTPLPRKLGIKPQSSLVLVAAPDGFDDTLGELPEGVTVRRALRTRDIDVVVLFCRSARDLTRRFATAAGRLARHGGLWVAWPKKSSGVASDLDENVVRRVILDHGLVDNKVCAIDTTWSGLRAVYRVRDR